MSELLLISLACAIISALIAYKTKRPSPAAISLLFIAFTVALAMALAAKLLSI